MPAVYTKLNGRFINFVCNAAFLSLGLKALGILCALSLGTCVARYVVKRNAQKQYWFKSKIKNNSNRNNVGISRVTYY